MRRITWGNGKRMVEDIPFVPVSRRQARLALGESRCAALDAAADNPALPWPMRDAIKSAHEWHRNAPEIDELAWLLGLTATDIDELFRIAATL